MHLDGEDLAWKRGNKQDKMLKAVEAGGGYCPPYSAVHLEIFITKLKQHSFPSVAPDLPSQNP